MNFRLYRLSFVRKEQVNCELVYRERPGRLIDPASICQNGIFVNRAAEKYTSRNFPGVERANLYGEGCNFGALKPEYMLQIAAIRENEERILAGLKKKNFADAEQLVSQVLEIDQQRKDTQKKADD